MRIIFPSVWSSASIMYLQALLIFVSATDVILKHIRTHSIRFPTSLCRYLFAQLMRDQEHSCSKRVYSKCIHKTTKKLHYTQSLFCFLASTHYALYERSSPTFFCLCRIMFLIIKGPTTLDSTIKEYKAHKSKAG